MFNAGTSHKMQHHIEHSSSNGSETFWCVCTAMNLQWQRNGIWCCQPLTFSRRLRFWRQGVATEAVG